jgi:hypothetical protein
MSTGLNADGRLEVFARGSDNRIYHNFQKNPGTGPWVGFTQLGSLDIFASGPSVVRKPDGHLHVFVRGLQNDLWHNFQMQLNSSWSGWQSHGGRLAGTPVPAIEENGQIVVFSTGADGQLMRISETAGWTWKSLGGELVGSPAACSNGDGVLVVLGAFNDKELRFRAQLAPNDDNWSKWEPLTGPVTATPAAILNLDLRMQIIIPGVGGELGCIEQTTAGDLSHWTPVPFNGIALGSPVISRNGHVLPDPDGRLEAFHIGLTRQLYSKWQTAPDGKWSGWASRDLTNLQPGLCVDRNNDQRLEVFAIDDTGSVQHTWQTLPGQGPWISGSLGGATLGGLGTKLEELGFRGAWWFRE